MSELFPVFIGITGKREFSDDPRRAEGLEERVRGRLAKIFDYLERQLPETPKILLTGVASGTDLIAAEQLLFSNSANAAHRHRFVVAVLPFKKELFQQDFEPEDWTRFERVANDPRTLVWELPGLRGGVDGRTIQEDDLRRGPQASEFQKDARRRHYEQVGLWIADQANVLIGVMSAEECPDRIGGTARIIAYRRGGWPDVIAAQVITASAVLAPRRELHRPPKGYVWLIDPLDEPLLAAPPVTVLPPAADGVEEQHMYKHPGILQNEKAFELQLNASLHPGQLLAASQRRFKIARDYAHRNRMDAASNRWESFRLSNPTPAQVLNGISRELEPYTPAEVYRRIIYMQVGGFVLAVLAFEIFAKYMHDKPWALAFYLVVLILIMGLYFYAEWRELQPTAEDRRAVREALRVQAAWWQAGLSDRVDHFYLEGADEDLAGVRDATRSAITWACLKCENQNPANWNEVFANSVWPEFDQRISAGQYPRDWIGNQLFYFCQRKEQRKIKAELFEAMSWNLFACAAGLSILLFFWFLFVENNHFVRDAIHDWLKRTEGLTPAIVTIGCVAGASVVWLLSEQRIHHVQVKWRRSLVIGSAGFLSAILLFAALQVAAAMVEQEARWTLYLCLLPALIFAPYLMLKLLPIADLAPPWLRGFLPDPNQPHALAVGFGLNAAVLLGFGLQAFAVTMSDIKSEHAAVYMTIVYIIFLPALAATMRFISEKTALQAEALAYRDAYCWYAHAAELLLELNPGKGDAAADRRAREIVLNLGKLALKENETWLKSRRQRPLSPLM